ncbi:uncharacterized protein LOC131858341 [Cryptomeria japonica]|uniref:uncharacterized protein LOC131858341 n=1 Tax=Cryptomeria japonica TaxID=3369 RepID=UPI0027DAA367|nr:uncharacterized protein LOC131858341 [Cryptomeria japonica]
MHCTSAKEIWDKFQRIYEADVKVAKLQNFQGWFEGLKMKEEEKILDYLQRVDEIVNAIRGIGEYVSDEVIVKKVLRSLTTKYDIKVSAIEEAKDLKIFSMDELFGSLSSYKMRTISVEETKREVVFTFEKKGKEVASSVDDEESDVVEANFVRKLKKGLGKYRGKLHFKFFDYGKIGHFVAKCPYKKEDKNEGNVKDTDKKFYKPRRNLQKKKVLYTFDSGVSNDESESAKDSNEDEKQTNLFMAQEVLNEDQSGAQSENQNDSEEEDADVG